MRARPVPMSARIGPHRVFFDMRADRVRREMQQNAARSLTARAVIDQFETRNIGDEIRIPGAVALDYPAFAAEKPLLPLKRSENPNELLKTKSRLRNRLIITGASVSATNLDGSSR